MEALQPTRRISLKQMEAETQLADRERQADERTPKPRHTDVLNQELPFKTVVTQRRGIVATSKNQRHSQEDRADFIMCDSAFAKHFHMLDIDQKAALLNARILKLAKETDHIPSGTTLTASLMWTSKEEATGKLISHVLTAHIGDSRAVIYTSEQATRLTRHHSFLRKSERDALEAESPDFKIEILDRLTPEYHSTGTEWVIANIFYKKIKVARQTNRYLRGGEGNHGALQPSRSLGDVEIHCSSPAFRRHADFSYQATPMERNPHLMTCSDGITDEVSDQNFGEILREVKGNCVHAALNTLRLAHQRDSRDNLSVVVTPLSTIAPGEVAFQFVADGHGGSEAVEHIAQSLREFPYHANKKLSPALLKYRRFCDPHIKDILDAVESGNKLETDALTELNKLGKNTLFLKEELTRLINEIFIVNKHDKNQGEKYELLRDLGQRIQSQDFKDISEVEAAARNFFYLALQRNYIGLKNTTTSGLKILELLNRNPEYSTLRNTFFEKKGLVQYRDIRAFVTGDHNKRKNERLFSGLNRKKACEFWKEVVKADNGIAINNIPAVINKVRPVR